MIFFWYFYDDRTKTFCRGFSAIYNFYIVIFRSNVIEYIDAGEHMVVLSYIQLLISNLGGTYLDVWCPRVNLGVSFDTGENILGCQ